jgi:hypothetical protein
VRAGAAVALRALVAATERGQRPRREVGQRLSLRVGSPFGVGAAGQWVRVKELLPKVRAWLAGEVLEVVFEHLRPETEDEVHQKQLEERRDFWKGFTGSVVRMWVAVCPKIQARDALEHPDVKAICEAMGDDLEVRPLLGRSEQALVWMHLQTRYGDTVTVVEGNADTGLRMRSGAIEPYPNMAPVDYSVQIVNGEFSASRSDVRSFRHRGDWQGRTVNYLNGCGVFPS